MGACSESGCTDNSHARGLCSKHYGYHRTRKTLPQVRKNSVGLSLKGKLEFYGWDVVQRDTPYAEGPCWEWKGNCFTNGYGQLYIKGSKLLTHRISYEVHKGPIPEGLVVRHKCDNRKCLNPEHLETGTTSQNSWDSVFRGRANRKTKISEEQASRILSRYIEKEPLGSIAHDFGVSKALVCKIGKRQLWRNLVY